MALYSIYARYVLRPKKDYGCFTRQHGQFCYVAYMLQHSSSESSQHISNSTVVSTSASGYNDGKMYDMNRAELLLMSPLSLSCLLVSPLSL